MINRNIVMKVSYMEIYNESVNDLLDANKRNMEVRDQKGEIIIESLTTQQVRNMDDIKAILKLGETIRIIAETKSNSKSTRSHTVFRIAIESDDHNV